MSIFTHVKKNKPKRTTFDLSHENKLTTEFGRLTPILCQEVLPGDKWRNSTEYIVKLSPMSAPIMHEVNVYVHYFFVPYRLLWKNWDKFITGGEDGYASPVMPTLGLVNVSRGSAEHSGSGGSGTLADYLGVGFSEDADPTSPQVKISVVNALPFRAYNLIYNEFYRDENLSSEAPLSLDDGKDTITTTTLRYRAWQKDYFTASLPWAQKGGEVHLPMTGNAPVELVNARIGNFVNPVGPVPQTDNNMVLHPTGVNRGIATVIDSTEGTSNPLTYDPNGSLEADLTNLNSATINELRRASALQRWLETNARAGSRYVESILAHFGVRSSDARIQRPEYLGGGRSPIVVSEILQTSETATTPQGTMSGKGTGISRNNNKFSYYAEEHGLILGIMSIMPRPGYMQGLPKLFKKFDRFDFAFPLLAHLGEQEVANYELYNNGDGDGDNNNVFGYVPRYSEYKYIPNQVHGDFKTTLDFWHLSRKFANRPRLNHVFVDSKSSLMSNNRIFAVVDSPADHFIVDCYHHIRATRSLPKYGTPML